MSPRQAHRTQAGRSQAQARTRKWGAGPSGGQGRLGAGHPLVPSRPRLRNTSTWDSLERVAWECQPGLGLFTTSLRAGYRHMWVKSLGFPTELMSCVQANPLLALNLSSSTSKMGILIDP